MAWIAPLVTVIFLLPAVLRLLAVLIQPADPAGSFKPGNATVAVLVRTLVLPGQHLNGLAARGRAWGGAFHPFGSSLVLVSAGLFWLMSSVPALTQWSGRGSLVLTIGLVAYVACFGVLLLWPASPAVRREDQNARERQLAEASAASPPPLDVPAFGRDDNVAIPVGKTTPGSAWLRSTEEALRRLNNPATLGECPLAGQLTWTLKNLAARASDLTPTSNHHALRAVLVRAIDHLKPVDGAGSGDQTLFYAILHDEYVLGHPTARILTRYSISESTFHRHRRDAIRAVAQDLATQEEAFARTGTVRRDRVTANISPAGQSMRAEPSPAAPYAFLSYASADRERALYIADLLEAHAVSVWIDRRSIAGGTNWSAEIVRGIRECAVLLVLSSSAAMSSPNVSQEVQVAWETGRPIVPLRLEAVEPADSIRYALAGRQWIEILDHPEDTWLSQVISVVGRLE